MQKILFFKGRIFGVVLTLGSLFHMILYNLDLRSYIIEPYFETLPNTIRDVDIKTMFGLYAQVPVDVDEMHVGWSRFIRRVPIR